MRIVITFEYDGSLFRGYASQPNSKTVQSEIEKSLQIITKHKIKIHSSGRTDKGVHANNQVAHFDCNIEGINYVDAINSNICEGISIKKFSIVDNSFHARYNTLSKEYIYKITNNFSVFERNYITYERKKIDWKIIEEGINLFLGEKNFSNFTASDEDKNKVRTIFNIAIKSEGEIKVISIQGNGFLKYMVRMIVGSLIELGIGKISYDELKSMINNPEIKVRKYKAKPNGLYLNNVIY